MKKDHLSSILMRASKGTMDVMELVGTADSLKKTNTIQDILTLYKTWIDHNADAPLMFAVLFNYSTIQTEVDDLNGARESLEKSIALNADFTPSRINLGRLYERLNNPTLSLAQWTEAINRLSLINGTNITHKTTALNQMARVLESENKDELAENLLTQSLEIDASQREVAQHLLAVRQRECKWPIVSPWERVSRETLMTGISPLSMAVYTDDPMVQLAANAHYNKKDIGVPDHGVVSSYWAACNGRKKAPLRIGYLSSDLREHAIGFLMSEVFGLHDRKVVDVSVYYCGVIPTDPTLERIKASVDHWVDINQMDDATAARRIADDGIQILVDVNAYTRDGRIKLVAMRPAPIIVNWLGFPGSAASPYHHYIIADAWIIPPAHEIYFSEKVLRLPCYQPNDRQRIVSPHLPTRKDVGLPEDAIVYCCFNGTQKMSKHTFARWLTILRRVPESVLWLLSGTQSSQDRVRLYAKEQGIAPERLIFADKKKNPDHLARYPLADLFLDTAPYGAHTTASDALWMGVPVLTFSGRSFASRVCGSLVRSANLPELACATSEEYIDRAVALGRDKEALQNYREQLAKTRDTCVLFDTPLLVQSLEGLYKEMWTDFEKGHLPRPNLKNLDVYLEIGAQQNHDDVEVQSMENYESWWADLLTQRHALRPIDTDHRFWTEMAQKTKKESPS